MSDKPLDAAQDKPKPKMLVVEDDPAVGSMFLDIFCTRFQILLAKSSTEAFANFAKNPDVALMILDGNLAGDDNSLEFCAEAKKSFHGPMICISSDEPMQKKMLELGCTRCFPKPDAVISTYIFLEDYGSRQDQPL